MTLKFSSRPPLITVEDYRDRARRKVPGMVWAYIDYGAEDHQTLTGNRTAFGRWSLRSRVLTGNEASDVSVELAGTPLSMPILLAPTGLAGMAHWTGERAAARAAEAVGTRAVLSTSASYSIEEVAATTEADHFFQLYPLAMGDDLRAFTDDLLTRARHNGYTGLFVTVDVPVQGNRDYERRRGMGVPPVITPARALDAAVRPAWTYGFLRHQRVSARMFENQKGVGAAVRSVTRQNSYMRPQLTWDHFAWIRERWLGPVYVKGVLEPDDADLAIANGADGIVVSNHGGRQLGGAPATLDVLPAIAERVRGRATLMLDGGIRRGSDVIKAMCLGADAVLIGRPYLYGLAARGQEGVADVLEILRAEMLRTMTLMGVQNLKELDPTWVIANSSTI